MNLAQSLLAACERHPELEAFPGILLFSLPSYANLGSVFLNSCISHRTGASGRHKFFLEQGILQSRA